MRLATFDRGGPRLGAMLPGDESLVDLRLASEDKAGRINHDFDSMQALIDSGNRGLDQAREMLIGPSPASIVGVGEVRLLAPILPRAMRCCSLFDGHHHAVARALKELGERGPASEQVPALLRAVPAYYKANHLNILGPGDLIEWPSFGDNLDFELELAAVIGKRGRDVPIASAADHIFGFTIYNDVSARKPQLAEMSMGLGPAKSKDFDGANILGPVIVTADEFDGGNALAIARIDGCEIGRSRSSGMRQSWGEIVAYRSLGETMHPGEIVTSGAFTGCSGIEHLRFLEPGEEIELEIAGIGTLANRVGPRPAVAVEWPDYGREPA